MTMDVEGDPVHLERHEGRGIELAVDVGLVARHVGIVDDLGIRDNGVQHGGGGEVVVVGGGAFHRRRRIGRGPFIAEVDTLGKTEAVIHRRSEVVLRHG